MGKLVAEFIGTFTLVLFGCGAAVIAGMGSGATSIDVLGISMAFGLATFIFLVCILGVTQEGAPTHMAGIAIGLTLVVIHIVGINVTGVSVNPARSIGPAIIGMSTNANAVSQLWLFIVAPLVGAGVAGLMFKSGLLAAKSE